MLTDSVQPTPDGLIGETANPISLFLLDQDIQVPTHPTPFGSLLVKVPLLVVNIIKLMDHT